MALSPRKSGVLLHISSLMGEYGIGTFGKNARRFVDFLAESGFHLWQVLPFTGIDSCNSPYKSDSAFAGNELFLDPETLRTQGLLTDAECADCRGTVDYAVDFDRVRATRARMLDRIWAKARLRPDTGAKLAQFRAESPEIADYALYRALKERFGCEWPDWPDEALRMHEPEAVARAERECADAVNRVLFAQLQFAEQWADTRAYANARGIEMIGDIPFYLALESADVWANRALFELDERGRPTRVAGVPPDYFSETGQKWGNPLYRWDRMRADGFAWWRRRLRHTLTLFDRVRIDHFRAFSAYWAVPADAETAQDGRWEPGVGMDFFRAMDGLLTPENGIAEDLGVQDRALTQLLTDCGLPGIRVLQFGFLGDGDDMNLPHRYRENTVAYSGTHDNNTLLAYLWELTPEQRARCLRYCGFTGEDWQSGGAENPAIRAVLRTLWSSHAKIVVAPIQDLCGFGRDTRMNQPGIAERNWTFRLTESAFASIDRAYLRELNALYCR